MCLCLWWGKKCRKGLLRYVLSPTRGQLKKCTKKSTECRTGGSILTEKKERERELKQQNPSAFLGNLAGKSLFLWILIWNNFNHPNVNSVYECLLLFKLTTNRTLILHTIIVVNTWYKSTHTDICLGVLIYQACRNHNL